MAHEKALEPIRVLGLQQAPNRETGRLEINVTTYETGGGSPKPFKTYRNSFIIPMVLNSEGEAERPLFPNFDVLQGEENIPSQGLRTSGIFSSPPFTLDPGILIKKSGFQLPLLRYI